MDNNTSKKDNEDIEQVQLSTPSLDSLPDYLFLEYKSIGRDEARRAFIFKTLVGCGAYDPNKAGQLEEIDKFIKTGSTKEESKLKVIK